MLLEEAFTQFFRANTILELKLLNENKFTPLNYHSLKYLDLIYYNESSTVSSLASTLNVAKSAVTQKVNSLVSKGMVEKIQSKEDKRVFYLKITKKAEEEYNFIFKPYIEATQEIRKKFSLQEEELCAKIISEFSSYMEQKI